jgi:hypothetical protein
VGEASTCLGLDVSVRTGSVWVGRSSLIEVEEGEIAVVGAKSGFGAAHADIISTFSIIKHETFKDAEGFSLKDLYFPGMEAPIHDLIL